MAHKKRFWVWVTGPKYYLSKEGQEREIFDPNSGTAGEGWWTCHKDTQAGDLALLYRTRPKSDIAYLMEAKSAGQLLVTKLGKNEISDKKYGLLLQKLCREDAAFSSLTGDYVKREDDLAELKSLGAQETVVAADTGDVPKEGSIGDRWNKWTPRDRKNWLREERQTLDQIETEIAEQIFQRYGLAKGTEVVIVSEWDGDFICDWKLRFRLTEPLTLSTLKSDSLLIKEWGGLRGGFRMRSYGIPNRVWGHLVSKIDATNPGFRKVAERLQGITVSADILSEKEFEDRLTNNLKVFQPEYDLELYVGEDGRNGRQYPCVEAGGFIDLLCRDRRIGGFVIVELKVARVGRETVGQIASYMGWVREHLAGKDPVPGLIVGAGYDEKFQFAYKSVPGLEFMDLTEIRSRLK